MDKRGTHAHGCSRKAAARKVRARLAREVAARSYLGKDSIEWNEEFEASTKGVGFDARVSVGDEAVIVGGNLKLFLSPFKSKAEALVRSILEEEFPTKPKGATTKTKGATAKVKRPVAKAKSPTARSKPRAPKDPVAPR